MEPVKLHPGGTLLWVRRNMLGLASEVWPIPKAWAERKPPTPADPFGLWVVRPPAGAMEFSGPFALDARQVVDLDPPQAYADMARELRLPDPTEEELAYRQKFEEYHAGKAAADEVRAALHLPPLTEAPPDPPSPPVKFREFL